VPELFPGQANFWDLDTDVAQVDGFWNQFEGNMVLAVSGLGLVEETFPADQTYPELSFMTPLLSALDGLKVAAVADHANYSGPDPEIAIPVDDDEGAASAWLNATADSRLQQTLDLRQASAPLTLRWKDQFLVQPGDFLGNSIYYRVVAIDPLSGNRTTLFEGLPSPRGVVETTPLSQQRLARSADLSAFAGRQAVLSFELRGAHQLLGIPPDNIEFIGSYARIDNVSLRDGGNAEFVTNGDFENGMQGWSAPDLPQSQNLRSAPRLVNDITITRHFYSVPNQLWARWTDVLTNNTGAEITRQVTLRTFLGSVIDTAPGSPGKGIIYATSSNRALTSWDGTNPAGPVIPDRDIGLVFGNPETLAESSGTPIFSSATALDTADGSPIIDINYLITIPAGGQVTLVHFALMDGENTGATAIDINARATTIDAEIANILNNFCTNPRYRDGMTQVQLNSLRNFTCP
jgi:hypothetical protein